MTPRAEMTRLGVLADTHMPHRLAQVPPTVIELLAGAEVDLILHAGDVDDPRFLEPLGRIAPVIAVRGNIHPQDLSGGGAELPFHVALSLCGRRLVLTHGHRRGPLGFWVKFALYGAYRLRLIDRDGVNRHIAHHLCRRFGWADVVVFGHSHRPFQRWIDGTFFFNPGAVLQDDEQPPSVGLLCLSPDTVEASIVPLSQGDEYAGQSH
ncbi:MAG: metallophosphoesterase family protein [Chloroflexota bacterium]